MPIVGLDHDCLGMELLPDTHGYENIHVWSYHIRSTEGGTAVGYHAILLARKKGSRFLTLLHTMTWADVWETDIFCGLTEDFSEEPTGSGLSCHSRLERCMVPSEHPSFQLLQTVLLDWLKSRAPPM